MTLKPSIRPPLYLAFVFLVFTFVGHAWDRLGSVALILYFFFAIKTFIATIFAWRSLQCHKFLAPFLIFSLVQHISWLFAFLLTFTSRLRLGTIIRAAKGPFAFLFVQCFNDSTSIISDHYPALSQLRYRCHTMVIHSRTWKEIQFNLGYAVCLTWYGARPPHVNFGDALLRSIQVRFSTFSVTVLISSTSVKFVILLTICLLSPLSNTVFAWYSSFFSDSLQVVLINKKTFLALTRIRNCLFSYKLIVRFVVSFVVPGPPILSRLYPPNALSRVWKTLVKRAGLSGQ